MTSLGEGAAPATVTRLRVHPVKGAQGCDVDRMTFDAMGPRHDRRWMVVRPNGDFISQRQTPLLATVRPTVSDEALTLAAKGAGSVRVPLAAPASKGAGGDPAADGAARDADHGAGATRAGGPLRAGERIAVRVWDSRLETSAPSPDADAWLSELLGGPCRLAHIADTDIRHADPEYAQGQRVSFADGYPLLVVGQGSVDELARRVGRPIPVERFRPNVVFEGAPPHDEDFWRAFSIGSARFRGVKLCARCKVTTLDQGTGERDPNGEPLRTLASYRRIESYVYFGLNTVHEGREPIRVGDPVSVGTRGIVRGAL